MEDHPTLTEEDEGKHVKNARGDEVGLVVNVEHGQAHVEPDPGITDSIRSKLGWGGSDEETTYELSPANIDRVTDDAIMLQE